MMKCTIKHKICRMTAMVALLRYRLRLIISRLGAANAV